MEAGEIRVFTFQDEYFFSHFRSTNFQDAKVEYRPTFGKAGLRLIAGGYHNYGPALYEGQLAPRYWNGTEIPFTPHWEAQAGYRDPAGDLTGGHGRRRRPIPILLRKDRGRAGIGIRRGTLNFSIQSL